jgi:hypothetical protein
MVLGTGPDQLSAIRDLEDLEGPAATRVRSDLGLPEPISHGPDGLGPPDDSFP